MKLSEKVKFSKVKQKEREEIVHFNLVIPANIKCYLKPVKVVHKLFLYFSWFNGGYYYAAIPFVTKLIMANQWLTVTWGKKRNCQYHSVHS